MWPIRKWFGATVIGSKFWVLSSYKEPQVFPYTELLAEQELNLESIPSFRGTLPTEGMLEAGKKVKTARAKVGEIIKERLKKDSTPIFQQISEIGSSIDFLPWLIHTIVDIPDKIKNVVLWKDPRKTSYLAFAFFVLWIAGAWIP